MDTKNKVLIVEDDIDLQAIYRAYLEELSLSSYAASNGSEGLKILENHYAEIGLIILDERMPVMRGSEFLNIKEKNSNFQSIPVIYLSGWFHDKEVKEANQTNIVQKLPKPIRRDAFMEHVKLSLRLK